MTNRGRRCNAQSQVLRTNKLSSFGTECQDGGLKTGSVYETWLTQRSFNGYLDIFKVQQWDCMYRLRDVRVYFIYRIP